MNDPDVLDYAQLAADQQFARDIAAGAPLVYDDTAPVPDLPRPGAPVMVVRPVRLPFDADQTVQALAKQRGMTPSELVRSIVLAAINEGTESDPVTELRRNLNRAQRALDNLARRRASEAA